MSSFLSSCSTPLLSRCFFFLFHFFYFTSPSNLFSLSSPSFLPSLRFPPFCFLSCLLPHLISLPSGVQLILPFLLFFFTFFPNLFSQRSLLPTVFSYLLSCFYPLLSFSFIFFLSSTFSKYLSFVTSFISLPAIFSFVFFFSSVTFPTSFLPSFPPTSYYSFHPFLLRSFLHSCLYYTTTVSSTFLSSFSPSIPLFFPVFLSLSLFYSLLFTIRSVHCVWSGPFWSIAHTY